MPQKRKTLGRVELEMLQYIDEHHPITVREIAEYWSEKTGQTRTTVLKMIDRLQAKGFLKRKKIDGVYRYSPREPVSQVVASLVGDFVRGVLGGSVSPVVAYLNEEGKLSGEEIAQLRKLLGELEHEHEAKENEAKNEVSAKTKSAPKKEPKSKSQQ